VLQNASISSGRPRDTRMYVSIGGNWRLIRMLFFRKCSITSFAGCRVSIITKFVWESIGFNARAIA
jgi:hypothetical protein